MGISRYLGFFLDETRGYLNTLERGIQALEAWPADSGRMHEIYLSVSSIHGMRRGMTVSTPSMWGKMLKWFMRKSITGKGKEPGKIY